MNVSDAWNFTRYRDMRLSKTNFSSCLYEEYSLANEVMRQQASCTLNHELFCFIKQSIHMGTIRLGMDVYQGA
jgi:hypothetical protein